MNRVGFLKKAMGDVLSDLAVHQLQLVREIMIMGNHCGWDETNTQLRELSWILNGAPSNTKFTLEDIFNHLRDVSGRQSKSKYMSSWTTFFYMTTAAILQTLKVPQLITSASTFLHPKKWREVAAEFTTKRKGAEFRPKTHLASSLHLPELGTLKRSWRPAGPAANFRSSSAMAYLEREHQNGFANIDRIWGSGTPISELAC